MLRMGIRQLRTNLSAALDRVQTGEVIEVTEHDRPVARIVPIAYRSSVDRLIAEGRLILPEGPGGILNLEPLEPLPGEPPRLLSDTILRMREEDGR